MSTYFFETITDAQAARYGSDSEAAIVLVVGSPGRNSITVEPNELAVICATERSPGIEGIFEDWERTDALFFGARTLVIAADVVTRKGRVLGCDTIIADARLRSERFGPPPRVLGPKRGHRGDQRRQRAFGYRGG